MPALHAAVHCPSIEATHQLAMHDVYNTPMQRIQIQKALGGKQYPQAPAPRQAAAPKVLEAMCSWYDWHERAASELRRLTEASAGARAGFLCGAAPPRCCAARRPAYPAQASPGR